MKGLVLCFLATLALAQEPDTLKPAADSLGVPKDTTELAPKGEKVRTKSVRTAMLLSALIPGAGQFYNESYIKGTLIAGGELTLGYFTVKRHLDMLEAKKSNPLDTLTIYKLRDARNTFAFFTGALIAFAVADAYVDANMFRFKEAQRLSLALPSEGLGLVVSYRF